jgi:hypothetical protein
MSAFAADLERSMWSADYVLAHCEGFRVESGDGVLGYVEEIVRAPGCVKPLALRVRTGFDEQGVVTVLVDDVVELHAAGERIVVRSRNHGRVGLDRTRRSAARPRRRLRVVEHEPTLAAR